MKAIERNISRHENGTYYFVARRQKRLTVISLRTRNLAEARRKAAIHRKQVKHPGESEEEETEVTGDPAALLAETPIPTPSSFADDLETHYKSMVLLSSSTEEMAKRGKAVVLRYCPGWDAFSAVEVWNAYRASRDHNLGRKLGSAANHLRWYLRKLVPWAIRKGLIGTDKERDLVEIPKVKVNPRTIRVPLPGQVDEFLRMIACEDPEGAEFLRFLAATGLRKTGATGLRWENVDLANHRMAVRMKGGRTVMLPMSQEAKDILEMRMQANLSSPWPLDTKGLERVERRMKRFAKGLNLDLTTFHSFRHYFASRALMAGLTVQEVATLLGHSDGGVLVLKTYGHICSDRLKRAVSDLRLTA